jgi:hypothetical protein
VGIENLLSRLAGVKQSGPGRWAARCPAHSDRSPSLAIRLAADGRILLHCFAGCDTGDILGAIGLEFGELFPEPLTKQYLPRIHAPFSALDALQCLASESAIVAIAASDLALGRPLSGDDYSRVAMAAGRIASALEGAHGL